MRRISIRAIETKRASTQEMMQEERAESSNEQWKSPQTAWTWLDKQGAVIFEDVGIARDGGVSDLGGRIDLWSPTRWVGAVITLACFVYNVFYIIEADIEVLFESTTTDEPYLLTGVILSSVTGVETNSWFSGTSEKTVVAVELFLLCAIFCDMFGLLLMIIFRPGYMRWHAVTKLFWDRIPHTGNYSAMKLLYFVTPQVLAQKVSYALFYSADCRYLRLLFIIFRTPFAAVIGIDCFLVKYRAAESNIISNSLTAQNLLNACIFLNQILGVVMLAWSTRDRLFRFIFGGKDGVMTPFESNRMDVWNAFVAQVIWQKYKDYWHLKAIAILLSWSDDDIQKLVVSCRERQFQ